MNAYQNYALETMVSGWTRIDMLLALYERAITSIRGAQEAALANDEVLLVSRMLESNRYLLALHGGLNTDEYEVAANVARLLNFIMLRLEQREFDEAVEFLEKLQSSFEQIREEATELERSGEIPPLSASGGLNTTA